jgi:hypothetical protein
MAGARTAKRPIEKMARTGTTAAFECRMIPKRIDVKDKVRGNLYVGEMVVVVALGRPPMTSI